MYQAEKCFVKAIILNIGPMRMIVAYTVLAAPMYLRYT